MIEPFAGSAGYASRYGVERDVTLVEKNPAVAGVWRWLIAARRGDVLRLPLVHQIPLAGVKALTQITQTERDLIGFMIGRDSSHPRNLPSRWALEHQEDASYWSHRRRRKLADHIHLINHWRIIEGDYRKAPDKRATWFVDPPYQAQRLRNMYGEQIHDYYGLGQWCRERRGQVIACDTTEADWLPFEAVPDQRGHTRMCHIKSRRPVEAYWVGGRM